jgi:hypothetical protein
MKALKVGRPLESGIGGSVIMPIQKYFALTLIES